MEDFIFLSLKGFHYVITQDTYFFEIGKDKGKGTLIQCRKLIYPSMYGSSASGKAKCMSNLALP